MKAGDQLLFFITSVYVSGMAWHRGHQAGVVSAWLTCYAINALHSIYAEKRKLALEAKKRCP